MAKSGNSEGAYIARKLSLTVVTVCINVVFYAAVIYGIWALSLYGYDFAYRTFGNTTVDEAPGRYVKVVILEDEDIMSVASKLEDGAIINDRYSFWLNAKLYGREVVSGSFIVSSAMSYDEIFDIITDPEKSVEEKAETDDN